MEFKFIICGLEHSGTTLVSDIFRQIEGVDSGFECGVLLGKSPRDFPNIQPFYNNTPGGWQVSAQMLEEICDTDDFFDFYKRLHKHSGFFDPQAKYIFDKTPRYFQHLFDCQEKIDVPFVVTYKDPRSIVYSDFKRVGKGAAFESWYDQYKAAKLRYLSKIYNNSYLKWKAGGHEKTSKIKCFALEDICLDTRNTVEQMLAHAGFDFKVSYLLMKNLRYAHTRMPQISSRIPFEYIESLSKQQIAAIEKDFAALEDWFYA